MIYHHTHYSERTHNTNAKKIHLMDSPPGVEHGVGILFRNQHRVQGSCGQHINQPPIFLLPRAELVGTHYCWAGKTRTLNNSGPLPGFEPATLALQTLVIYAATRTQKGTTMFTCPFLLSPVATPPTTAVRNIKYR